MFGPKYGGKYGDRRDGPHSWCQRGPQRLKPGFRFCGALRHGSSRALIRITPESRSKSRGGWPALLMMFLYAIYAEGAPSLRFLQGRVVMPPARPLSFCTNPVAHVFVVPALCKLRKGRGTLCFVCASEFKTWATRPSQYQNQRRRTGVSVPHWPISLIIQVPPPGNSRFLTGLSARFGMTSLLVEGGVPQRLKPGWFLGASYAALEAPLFHVTACFRGPTEFPSKIRIKTKINVNGAGGRLSHDLRVRPLRRGCPVLAFFARAGRDAADSEFCLLHKSRCLRVRGSRPLQTAQRTGHPLFCLCQRIQKPGPPAPIRNDIPFG